MGRRHKGVIAAGVLFYCAVAGAFLARLPLIDRGIELLPPWVVGFVMTVVGPAVLLSDGVEAWPAVAGIVILVAALLGLARVAWRRSPDTEWFAAWMICAAVVWGGSAWLFATL